MLSEVHIVPMFMGTRQYFSGQPLPEGKLGLLAGVFRTIFVLCPERLGKKPPMSMVSVFIPRTWHVWLLIPMYVSNVLNTMVFFAL